MGEGSSPGRELNSVAEVLIDSGEGVGWARRAVEEKAVVVGVETRLLYGESEGQVDRWRLERRLIKKAGRIKSVFVTVIL